MLVRKRRLVVILPHLAYCSGGEGSYPLKMLLLVCIDAVYGTTLWLGLFRQFVSNQYLGRWLVLFPLV